MISRIEIIETSLKKRRRKRNFLLVAIIILPLLASAYLINERSSQRHYASSVASVSNTDQSLPKVRPVAADLLVDTANRERTILDTAAQNASPDSLKQGQSPSVKATPETSPQKAKIERPKLTSNPEAKVENSNLRPGSKPKTEVAPAQKDTYYISMPTYEAWPLKRKMDLMRNSAYSPQEKAALRRHITNQFANRARARVSVIDQKRNGKPETRSYPIGMYLDRLAQNPKLQFRLVEKVNEGGALSGLVVKE